MTLSDNSREVRLTECLDEALAQLRAGRAVDPGTFPSPSPDLAEDLPTLLRTMIDLASAADNWRGAAPATRVEALHVDPGSADTPSNTQARLSPETGPVGRVLPPEAAWKAGSACMPQKIGRYLILDRIGSGGMGTVYKALDEQLQRVVALKVPRFDREHPNRTVAIQRFLREARSAALIRHSRICPIYDSGEDEGTPYVVMAYVEGQSLAERLSDNRPLEDLNQAVTIILQVAEALHVVHSHGIIHRDLKPGNILLDKAGQIVLTDFGLARTDNDNEHLTAEGAVVGTPAYMAPEQATGDIGRIGTWTDIYSLGVVFFKMITGRLPFEGPMLALIYKAAHESVPAPSRFRKDLDHELNAILLKALARCPEGRYQTAREFAEALEQWSGKHRQPADPPATASLERGHMPTQIEAALPDGSTVAVTVKHPGGSSGKVNVKVSDQQATGRKRRRFMVSITLAFALLLVVVGASIWSAQMFSPASSEKETHPGEPSFRLLAVPRVQLKAGGQGTITVAIRRDRFTGPVQLVLEGLPDSVKSYHGQIPSGEDLVRINLSAELDAVPRMYTIKVHARAGELHETTSFELRVDKPIFREPDASGDD